MISTSFFSSSQTAQTQTATASAQNKQEVMFTQLLLCQSPHGSVVPLRVEAGDVIAARRLPQSVVPRHLRLVRPVQVLHGPRRQHVAEVVATRRQQEIRTSGQAVPSGGSIHQVHESC